MNNETSCPSGGIFEQEKAFAGRSLPALTAKVMLEQKGTRVLSFTGGALLVEKNGLQVLSAETLADAVLACEALPRADCLCCDLKEALPFLREKYGLTGGFPCLNAVYEKQSPPEMDGSVRLAPLTLSDAPPVAACYTQIPEEEVLRHIQDGTLLGGFQGDEWMGFIGIHDEGSMGMLHVFEHARRRGMGFAMEALLIQRLMKEGKTPFAQIRTDNRPSIALQKKLGMTLGETPVYWLE